MGKSLKIALAITLVATASGAGFSQPASRPTLEEQFRNPPNSARPRVWWHWMNGNISKDGIAKDFAWMKRVGIGGVQNFDANQDTPQVVDKRLVYMTPEWKDAFRFAVAEAEKHGLEFTIAASPGWSETGGPWVPAQDGMKKLVWSEALVEGGKRFTRVLPALPLTTGPYQDMAKLPGIVERMTGQKQPPSPHKAGGQTMVLAVPEAASAALATPTYTGPDGKVVDATALTDGNPDTVFNMPGTGEPMLTISYPKPQTIRSAHIYLPTGYFMWIGKSVDATLEAENTDGSWRKVVELPVSGVPTTASFADVTASKFRVTFKGNLSGFSTVMREPSEGVDGFARPSGPGMARIFTAKIGELSLSAAPRVDVSELKAGFGIAEDYYALSAGVPDVKGVAPGQVINLTDRVKPDGTLDWTPPKGRWKVLRFGWSLIGTENHPAPKEATGLEVDKYDGAAVRRYLDHYIGMYREASGGKIGKGGVQGILTDSIEVGAANWTPKMVEQFKKLRGYDPTPWMPTLTGVIIGSRAESDKFLYDYRRTLADLLASEHYGTVAKVARENGMIVYGEALENGRPSLGDDMAMRRHVDVPMSAMWTHRRDEGPQPHYIADIRGAASVAHIYGQNLVAAESLTSSQAYWDHSPRTLKRIIDLEFVNGVNRTVIHTSPHQPVDDKVPGISLGMFGQMFNRHESWAEMARPWVDYMARNSLMLQQGRHVADVAYFYGEEQPLTELYQNELTPDAPKSYGWDFVNADALINELRNDGADLVTSGGARYKALYLGGTSRKMTLPVLRKIAALVEGGALVIGKRPETSPSLGDSKVEFEALVSRLWSGRVVDSNDVEAALASKGVAPDFTFKGSDGADIPFLHRKLADGDSYFLVNRGNRPEEIAAHFRVNGKYPELLDPISGKSKLPSFRQTADSMIVPLVLLPEQSVHVVFRHPVGERPPSITTVSEEELLGKSTPRPMKDAVIAGPWTVAFQLGRGAPASVVMDTLTPLEKHSDPGIKYFSGTASYAKSFTTPKGWKAGQPLWIDLGTAYEVAEVLVNGQSAGYAWTAPYRVDISAVAKPGKNALEIRVANLWVNRLIGDAQPGAKKITWTSQGKTYRADAKLRPSGLIGPVTLHGN